MSTGSLSTRDRRATVWSCRRERSALCNIFQHYRFGGESLIMWGGISLECCTDLHMLATGTLTAWMRSTNPASAHMLVRWAGGSSRRKKLPSVLRLECFSNLLDDKALMLLTLALICQVLRHQCKWNPRQKRCLPVGGEARRSRPSLVERKLTEVGLSFPTLILSKILKTIPSRFTSVCFPKHYFAPFYLDFVMIRDFKVEYCNYSDPGCVI